MRIIFVHIHYPTTNFDVVRHRPLVDLFPRDCELSATRRPYLRVQQLFSILQRGDAWDGGGASAILTDTGVDVPSKNSRQTSPLICGLGLEALLQPGFQLHLRLT